jgi:hypothetical protein
VVGTSNEAPNLLALCEAGKSIGDLSHDEQVAVFDSNSRDRFSALLDILKRLQLIEMRVQTAEEARGGATGASGPPRVATFFVARSEGEGRQAGG